MVLAVIIILLVVGSVLFHVLSPWYLTELASHWNTVDFTIDVTFWVTGIAFVLVNLFMAYAIIRYRYNDKKRSEYKPEDKKLEGWLIGITSLGVAAMLAPGLFVWAEFVDVPDEAHVVEAVGQQWHWSFRLPGEDGKFGAIES
ncbi:MAG: cytochrome-c oxidase, partial [Burkholderiales bacterium]|nr:cytochrome-c oxidase [Burkholderiales bacterium]